MAEIPFVPVLLGSDANVYGMARSFHEAYGVRSIAISKTIFTATIDTKIIDFVLEPDLENPEKFLNALMKVKEMYRGKKRLLVPCGDGYVKLVVKLRDKLSHHYLFNCPSEDILDRLSLKDSFYETCDKYGFMYPKTEVVTAKSYKTQKLPFDFPVVVKASNSVEYWKCSFEGKMKVFVAKDAVEYSKITEAIYSSSYQDSLTVQEFIPGDDSYMRVLNCYVSARDGKVKLLALGHALLEEHTPQGIGSYVAIISTTDRVLTEKFRVFLEEIGYTGFANFDMKLDKRDGQYKLFETNVRQGRSSYFVTAAGYNLAEWLVEDLVFERELPLTVADNEHLWLQVPKGIVYKYVPNAEAKEKARKLIAAGKWTNSLFYSKDLKPTRYLKLQAYMLNHYKKYKRYYGKKGLSGK